MNQRGESKETGENCIMRSFIVCTHNQIIKSRLINGWSIWHMWRSKMHIGFWWGYTYKTALV